MLAVCKGREGNLEATSNSPKGEDAMRGGAPSNSPKGEDAMRGVRKEMIEC